VFVVTNAGRSRRQEIDDRQRKYLIKMGIRTLCLVLAIALSVAGAPLGYVLVLIIAATVLPWMSVVVANAGPIQDERRQRPEVYQPDAQPALRPGRGDLRP